MSWTCILQNTVPTTVFINCHCCDKRLDLAEDRFAAKHMTDAEAVRLAHKRRWTVGSADGQTLCPKCQRLPDDVAFDIYVARLKEHYPHYELCQIWGAARQRYRRNKPHESTQ